MGLLIGIGIGVVIGLLFLFHIRDEHRLDKKGLEDLLRDSREARQRLRCELEGCYTKVDSFADWFRAQGLNPDDIWDKKPKAIPAKKAPASKSTKAKKRSR